MERFKLRFRPDVHGFAFGNSFNFDRSERAVLGAVGGAAAAALTGLLPPVPLLPVPPSVIALGYLNLGPLPAYGLCGGLAYSAADHWRARAPLPRGNGFEPLRSGAGAPVRALLWSRLLDSLGPGGVLLRTLHWMLLHNLVPQALGGGAEGLRDRTRDEYVALKSRIQLGMPVPIGVVGTTLAAWDQHQVLVYGYEEHSMSDVRLFIYDPNGPRGYGQPTEETLNVDLTAPVLTLSWPSQTTQIGAVRGFFCSAWGALPVDPTLARRFGQFQRETLRFNRVFLITDGAKFGLASGSSAELAALGATPADVMPPFRTLTVMNPPEGGEPAADEARLLMDGTLLREPRSRTTWLSAGGALFAADTAAINFFGGAAAVRGVPAGSLLPFPRGPQQGQLLRELGSTTIWLIDQGQRREMTAHANFAPHGGHDAVRTVPAGALGALPVGLRLPQPTPGECQRLRSRELQRVRDVAQAEEAVADAPNQRLLAQARGRLQRLRDELAVTRGRIQVLGC